MAANVPEPSPGLVAFLKPLQVDRERILTMSREFSAVFTHLAAESEDQFLPTPISESILLPFSQKKKNQGRGGTNLRVGFIELLGEDTPLSETVRHTNGHAENGAQTKPKEPHTNPESKGHPAAQLAEGDSPYLRRLHERSWSIQAHLKNQNADSLFAWIGSCIASVVREGCITFGLPKDVALPMGVTFSFPMEQDSLSEAKLMSMGKGFAIASKLDLGSHLVKGYEKARAESTDGILPPITIAAIANDSVSTLVSFVYEVPALANQKAAMGIICGTGSNATLLLKRSKLHPSKRPKRVNLLPGEEDKEKDGADDQVKIAVNTEWSINGTAPAMRAVNLISRWDDQLSQSVEVPGFQPLEYMTAGRYLGELGRIMLVDYMTTVLGLDQATLPSKFLQKFEPHNTTFLSHYQPGKAQSLLDMLEAEFPVANGKMNGTVNGAPNGQMNGYHSNGTATSPAPSFHWTEEISEALYHIAKAIEKRAAAIIAAAIVGLLDCADELPPPKSVNGDVSSSASPLELVVGYTGGCITNFQDYLADCQAFLDDLVAQRYSASPSSHLPVRIVLSPCHDGGIKGAGILVPASLASQGLIKA